MTSVQLDKIHTKFRHLVDLLMFSDKMDLDLDNFEDYLYLDYTLHSSYLQDRFRKACDIYWEDNQSFWHSRLTFLLSLNDKPISKGIERYLEQRMFSLVRNKRDIHIKYDLEYIQFVCLCNIKYERKESLLSVKNYLTEMPSHVRTDKLIKIVNSFIPTVFVSMDEYAATILHKITHSARNFDILVALEKQNVKFDKSPLIQLAIEIISERARSTKNILALFSMINDSSILGALKKEYTEAHRSNLLDLLNNCDYSILEEYHLRNIKNLISLDPTIADDIAVIYANKLYARKTAHKRANVDRIIRLLNTFPEISPKKILAYLSSNNKMVDIKHIIAAFPNLRKLAVFV